MSTDLATLDARNARTPAAFRWLRHLAEIQSLREADRRYRAVVGGGDMAFGSLLSKWERGATTQRFNVVSNYLAILGYDFADLETALVVAAFTDHSDPTDALAKRIAADRSLADRLFATARKVCGGSRAKLSNAVVEAARQAL